MPAWDTTDFLTRVKSKAQWPTNAKLNDTQILQVADEELWSYVAPMVRGVSEAYWVKRYTVALTTGQPLYRIPSRVTAGTVFDVSLVSDSGSVIQRLSKIQAADLYMYGANLAANTGTPGAYCIEADQIRLLPTPGSNLSLLVRYERRPSQLTTVALCAAVTSVASLSVTTGTSLGTGTYDIAQSQPNFDALYDSVALTETGAGPYTYTATSSLSETAVGDYICPVGTTCIVPAPDVTYPVLIDKVAAECLSRAGDSAGETRCLNHLAGILDGVLESLKPRAETSAMAIFNRWSPMRGG